MGALTAVLFIGTSLGYTFNYEYITTNQSMGSMSVEECVSAALAYNNTVQEALNNGEDRYDAAFCVITPNTDTSTPDSNT